MAPRGDEIAEARRDWTVLGEADPLWAVFVYPGRKGGGWDLDEFLATGRADVAQTVTWLEGLGRPTRWERALDFGCGVGRLSQALTGYADQVVGVDISPSMLDAARRIDRTEGKCSYVLNDTPDLAQFPDGHFDLVYCILVLQHLPRPAVDAYLAEFLRVLRPGGTAVVQLASRALWTVKGMIWRITPFPLIRFAQTRILRYPAPMRMTRISDRDFTKSVESLGGKVVARTIDLTFTQDFHNTRYALRRG